MDHFITIGQDGCNLHHLVPSQAGSSVSEQSVLFVHFFSKNKSTRPETEKEINDLLNFEDEQSFAKSK